ncbi:hypothetical protein SARC_03342 [Sphaeroforma arctica JP610]|uniref:Uncharacterized protein n=1 Tax=Sphaeroforma arctica JP610 TaxID=667725 RepID=A0A0L0G5Z6_9EUKA|nr:hypothetical protein SARC_03342 [Sphaeroforma arctica JP610]KNC84447.1 hypothetical protein SARC_03342 [Sphaeroforma arctica JP610]|eukprot:XP_014158349.1 hypothetical protein SARC_03342 [Sphaeroforma arctica JP610]
MNKLKDYDDIPTEKLKNKMSAASEDHFKDSLKGKKSLEGRHITRSSASADDSALFGANLVPLSTFSCDGQTIQRRATSAHAGKTTLYKLAKDVSTPTATAPKKRRRWSFSNIFKLKSSSKNKHTDQHSETRTMSTSEKLKDDTPMDGSDPLALTYQLHNSKKKYAAQARTAVSDCRSEDPVGKTVRTKSSGQLPRENSRPISTVGPLKMVASPAVSGTSSAISSTGLRFSLRFASRDSLSFDKNWLVTTPTASRSTDSIATVPNCRLSPLRIDTGKPESGSQMTSATMGQLKSCLKTPANGKHSVVSGLVSPRLPMSSSVSPRRVSQVASMSPSSTIFFCRPGSLKHSLSQASKTSAPITTQFDFDNRPGSSRRQATWSVHRRVPQEGKQQRRDSDSDDNSATTRTSYVLSYASLSCESMYSSRTTTPEIATDSTASAGVFHVHSPACSPSNASHEPSLQASSTQDEVCHNLSDTCTRVEVGGPHSPDIARPRHNSQLPQLNVTRFAGKADVPSGSPCAVTYIGRGAGHGRPYYRSMSLEPSLNISSPHPNSRIAGLLGTPRCISGPCTPTQLLVPTQLYQYPTYTRAESCGRKMRRGSAPSPVRQMGSSIQQRAKSIRKTISNNTSTVKHSVSGRGKSTSLSSTPVMTRGVAARTETNTWCAHDVVKARSAESTRRATFSTKAIVTPTFSHQAYNRSGCVVVAGGLSKEDVVQIYTDLMSYKLSEMEVHEDSVKNINTNMANMAQMEAQTRTDILDAIVEQHLKAERQGLVQTSKHLRHVGEEADKQSDEIVLSTAALTASDSDSAHCPDSPVHSDTPCPPESACDALVGVTEASRDSSFRDCSVMDRVLMVNPGMTYRSAPAFSDSSMAALRRGREKMLSQLERSDTKSLLQIQDGKDKSGGVLRSLRIIGPKVV